MLIFVLIGIIFLTSSPLRAGDFDLDKLYYSCSGYLKFIALAFRPGLTQPLRRANLSKDERNRVFKTFLNNPQNFRGDFTLNIGFKTRITAAVTASEGGDAIFRKDSPGRNTYLSRLENINWMVNTLGQYSPRLAGIDQGRIIELTVKYKHFPGGLAEILNHSWAIEKNYRIPSSQALIFSVEDLKEWGTKIEDVQISVRAGEVLKVLGIAKPIFEDLATVDSSIKSLSQKYEDFPAYRTHVVYPSFGKQREFMHDFRKLVTLYADLSYREITGSIAADVLATRLQKIEALATFFNEKLDDIHRQTDNRYSPFAERDDEKSNFLVEVRNTTYLSNALLEMIEMARKRSVDAKHKTSIYDLAPPPNFAAGVDRRVYRTPSLWKMSPL